jgi:hypothetical protein
MLFKVDTSIRKRKIGGGGDRSRKQVETKEENMQREMDRL